MHIIVPTGDFLRLLARLKPLKSITTTGFSFPIYTLEAHDNKVRLIVSDNTSIVASTEMFATVTEPGIVSLNGNDFFQMVAKIPSIDNKASGSKNLDLQSTGTKLTLDTVVHYNDIKKNIAQKRVFTLVSTNLNARDDFNPQGDQAVRIKLPALYLSDVFKVLGKTVASYTSDMVGLSGVLIRCRAEQLLFVVSDGFRIIEITYPTPIQSHDFDLILPKITCSLLQTLIYDGDELEIISDHHQVKFRIDTDGLITSVISTLIVAYFPPYDSIFSAKGPKVKLHTRLLADNIANVRQVLEEEPYKVKLSFSNKQLTLTNFNPSAHVSFSNQGLPLLAPIKSPFDLIINAILLDNSLSVIGSESISIMVPEGHKPIIIDNEDPELRVKIAIALTEDD